MTNFDLKQKVTIQKNKLEVISNKFKEIKSLAIKYKENKDLEIKKLNEELENFRHTIEKIILYMNLCLIKQLNL